VDALCADFFARHPDLSLGALGARANAAAIDTRPFGQPLTYYAAEDHPDLVERYRAANGYAFPGELALPGWVLSDLYLLPGAIGLLLCPARTLAVPLRKRLGLHADDKAIAAAYLGAPTVTPGLFIGVSLISLLPGIHAGAWVKATSLRMLRATRMRGIAQWQNPSVRVHTRMGPLRVVGAVPGTHEFRHKSFVYETDLGSDARWRDAMARKLSIPPTRRLPPDDASALNDLLTRAEQGEQIHIVPPGLDARDGLLVREGPM
jgi:hypothetical protein